MHLALYYMTNESIRETFLRYYINMQQYILLAGKSFYKMALQRRQFNFFICGKGLGAVGSRARQRRNSTRKNPGVQNWDLGAPLGSLVSDPPLWAEI